jgi:hypothetical protein
LIVNRAVVYVDRTAQDRDKLRTSGHSSAFIRTLSLSLPYMLSASGKEFWTGKSLGHKLRGRTFRNFL